MQSGNSSGRTKKAVFLAAFAVVGGSVAVNVHGATPIPYVSGSYFQDFNNLINTAGVSYSFTGQGSTIPVDIGGTLTTGAGMPGWQLGKVAGSSADPKFMVDDGSNTGFGPFVSGSFYSYGTAGSTDRAAGGLASGSVTAGWGAVFVNNSANTYTKFTLSYTGEQWRRGDNVANVLTFSHQIGAAGLDIISGTFTVDSQLNFTAPVTSGTNIALDGNLPANQTAISASVSGISWGPGQELVIRWADFNTAGTDDGLGVDDMTFLAGFQGNNLTWSNAAATNAWNTTDNNWTGATTAFANGDDVNFTDTGVGPVVVDAGGVTPENINVSNTTGTYTFTGGSIGGTGKLTKTGAGSLVISNANTFSGGVVLADGVTSIAADSALGAATSQVTFSGGTLMLTGNVATVRSIFATAGSGSTIDTNGNSATFGNMNGSGSMTKLGSGSLFVNGTYGITGQTRVLGGSLVINQPGGTGTINASATGTDFTGDIVLANAFRLNIQAPTGGGVLGGGGKILVQVSGAAISGSGSNTSTINNNIELNSDNLGGPFVTSIGNATAERIIGGVISGNSDVNFASSATTGGGAGTVTLNAQNTYTGATLMNNTAGSIVKIGVNDGLPTGTAMAFNTSTTFPTPVTGPGSFDLNGFNQTVASLETGAGNGSNAGARVINNAGVLSTFTVSGSVTPANPFAGSIADGTGVLKLAKAGSNTLLLTGANTYTGGTEVAGGVLQMRGAAAWNPSLNGPGTTDITGGRAVYDYSLGDPDPAATITTILTNSYNNGGFVNNHQLHSSNADSNIGLGWGDDTVNKLVSVVRTYYGDADLNLIVDTVDFNLLASKFSQAGVWGEGDFDYNGVVDTVDFNLLASNFGKPALGDASRGTLGALVPEPTSLGLLAFAATGLAARRRRK